MGVSLLALFKKRNLRHQDKKKTQDPEKIRNMKKMKMVVEKYERSNYLEK
jgi:hypothetical protein